jgi:gentisate 1,2-dioxygenase
MTHTAPSIGPREAMERLNCEAAEFHIWLRTQANAPAQRPWFRETGLDAGGRIATGRVGAAQLKPVAHHWRWKTNPGLGGRLQVTSTMRCAVSIYNPGDVAPVHIHTPNASRTILSDKGGYTTIDGERCEAARGDLILTPNGTWHDHGNDGVQPVVWIDVLDFPLMEFLDCVWLDEAYPGKTDGNVRAQRVVRPPSYSQKLYGRGGLVPRFAPHQRGFGRDTTPMFHYRGADIREALDGLRQEEGDPYDALSVRFVNPATGASLFPTLDYGAQLLRPGEATRSKREIASTLYVAMEGEGVTEIAGQRFEWRTNDIFVVPGFAWRRHVNDGSADAILYTVSDAPLLDKIGQYRAQGRLPNDTVAELVP